MFGSDDYVYPWVRWLSGPPLRIGILLVCVPIVVTGHATWVSTLGVACLVVSLVAGSYEHVERRRRDRAFGP